VGKPEGKKPLGKPRYRCVDNMKTDIRKTEWIMWTGLIRITIRTSGELL
jgi:hypothetical protein